MARIDGPARGEGLQAVTLAFQILEFLAGSRGGAGVSDIARALGTTKSRVHRHLRTLVASGYIVQSPESEKYGVGGRLLTLGRAVAENHDLASLARDALRDLRDQVGQSAVISRADREGAVVLASLAGPDMIEIVVRPGAVMALHCTAQGKLVLAHGEAALRERVLLSRLEMRTPHTITDPDVLRAELERIRAQGWATAPGESMEGVNALAAPVFDGGGVLVGTLAILGSIQFIRATPSAEQTRHVVAAAARLSAQLGHRRDER